MINHKIEITKYVMNQLQIQFDDKIIRRKLPVWWKNPRQKVKGGMGLTKEGFEAFKAAEIKNYRIKFEENLHFDNNIILSLDKIIPWPFYITHKDIYVFDESTAIQIILFGGNVKKFLQAKKRNSTTT